MAVIRRKFATDRPASTEPAELALLEDAQQLRLRLSGRFADLVEKERPAVGELEHAHVLLVGAGERSPLVPEELALQERLGDGVAVEGDELAAPRAG